MIIGSGIRSVPSPPAEGELDGGKTIIKWRFEIKENTRCSRVLLGSQLDYIANQFTHHHDLLYSHFSVLIQS